MSQAKKFISEHSEKLVKNVVTNSYSPIYKFEDGKQINNEYIISLIKSSMSRQTTILKQETYIFSDQSYIARLDEDYYHGDNVDEFLMTEDLLYMTGH